MEKYLVFAGMDFYANGGINDYIGDISNIGSVERFLNEICWDNEEERYGSLDWFHIVDRDTMKMKIRGRIEVTDWEVKGSLELYLFNEDKNTGTYI